MDLNALLWDAGNQTPDRLLSTTDTSSTFGSMKSIGRQQTNLPASWSKTCSEPEILTIAIPVDVGVWNDFYIEWEGDYLIVQVNDEEPQEYQTSVEGFFHTPHGFLVCRPDCLLMH